MMHADAAQAFGGRLYVLGGGWSEMGPAAAPFALVIKIEVPFEQIGKLLKFHVTLVTEEGKPIALPVPPGEPARNLEFGGEFEVPRPPGHPDGGWLSLPLVINFAPMMLPPGKRFEWVLRINDQENEHWRLALNSRTLPAQNAAQN